MGQKLCLVIESPILNLGTTLNESSGVKFRIIEKFTEREFQDESIRSCLVGP